MALKYKRFAFHMNYEGLAPHTFSWPKYKAYTEALVRALSAMENGPTPDQIVPVDVTEGCVAPAYEMPVQYAGTVVRLAHGPNRKWTQREREGYKPLNDWFHEHRATCTVNVKNRDYLFAVPTNEPPVCYTSYDTIDGVVFTVGGRDEHVHLEWNGVLQTFFGRPGFSEDFGKCLYHRVLVSAKLVRNEKTNDIECAEIISLDEDLGHYKTAFPDKNAVQRIRNLLADSMKDFDPEEFMKEMRDG